jgi:hypothetical protein
VLTNIPCNDDKTTFMSKIPKSDPPRFLQEHNLQELNLQ